MRYEDCKPETLANVLEVTQARIGRLQAIQQRTLQQQVALRYSEATASQLQAEIERRKAQEGT